MSFSGDGQQTVDIANKIENANAVFIQNVDIDPGPGVILEERSLIAGTARTAGGGSNMAIARLCNNGNIDNGDDTTGCGGTGFGDHSAGDASGILILSFAEFETNNNPKTINAIAIQQDTNSTCADTSPDKILLGAYASVEPTLPANRLMAVVRLCADGQLDVSWGGRTPDWAASAGADFIDPDGVVTIVYNDQSAGFGSWTRDTQPFAMQVEPDTNRITVAGFSTFPPSLMAPRLSYFAVARLCKDGFFDDGDHMEGSKFVDGHCGPDGFGPDDKDRGRIAFDDDGDLIDDLGNQFDTRSVVNGIQLVEDGNDIFDILIAGTTRSENVNSETHNIFVARIDSDGENGTVPWVWVYNKNFDDSGVHRDDIATDVAFRGAPNNELIVTGMTCLTSDSCADINNHTPSSDVVIARLDFSNGNVDYAHRVTADFGGFSTYTDVSYSVVFQPQSTGDPKIAVGGFSVESNGGRPYMSGRRFEYDNPSPPTTFDFFKSDFGGTGAPGDKAWELQVQSNRRIVAGGTHTVSAGNPVFGIIRICKTPDESPCTDPPAPGGGSGGGSGQAVPPSGTSSDSLTTDSTARPEISLPPVTSREESPAPPEPEPIVTGDVTTPSAGTVPTTAERSAIDYLFALMGLELPLVHAVS